MSMVFQFLAPRYCVVAQIMVSTPEVQVNQLNAIKAE